MLIRFEEEGIPIITCPQCEDIEISDLVLRGESGLHCKHCDSHLGYLHDLHPQYQAYVAREK